jgi:hypothetical protein
MKEIATPRRLAELLSAKTGLSERALKTRVEYLREAGLQPGGTFGAPTAPRLTLKSAAIQILGITAPVQIEVARHVRRVGDLQCDPARYAHPDLIGSGVEHVLPLLKGNTTFLSALVHLLRALTGEQGFQILDQVRGIGVIEGAGVVQAWIEPRMSKAWQAQKKAPERIYFGRVGVIPLTTVFTQETALNSSVLYEVARLFLSATTKQGESYVHESEPATGEPSSRLDRAPEPQGVQPNSEVSAS